MQREGDTWLLLGIGLVWAILWLILHYFKPGPFPLIGVPIGLAIVVLLLIVRAIDRRK